METQMIKFRVLTDDEYYYVDEFVHSWFSIYPCYWRRIKSICWQGVVCHNKFQDIKQAKDFINHVLRKRQGLEVVLMVDIEDNI